MARALFTIKGGSLMGHVAEGHVGALSKSDGIIEQPAILVDCGALRLVDNFEISLFVYFL